MIVGATKNPDGSIDYSRAAVMVGERNESADTHPFDSQPAEAKLRQDQQDSKRVLQSIGELYLDEKGNDTVLSSKTYNEWIPAVFKALQEPKGSVTREHENLVGPMSMLAWHALRRDSLAEQRIAAAETDPGVQKLQAEAKSRQDLAQGAMKALMERFRMGLMTAY
jgi:hypothetical protein